MNLLLDTHIFLWYISGDSKLPDAWRIAIQNAENSVALSVAPVWEATVKFQLGKLPLPQSPSTYLPSQRVRHRIHSLTLDERSVARLTSLPQLHRDPFDRMLICQAIEHRMTIVTVDVLILQYQVVALPAA